MPFCPDCKYEYREGVQRCGDCGTELVAALPEEKAPPETKWVRLHALPGPVYAEMVKAALERHDIPCLIKKDFISSAYGTQGTSVGGLETFVLVPEDRFEESQSILNQMLDHI